MFFFLANQPALSIGNVGQLAVDLLVSSTAAERVGYLDDLNLLPCVGNDAYGPLPCGDLALPLEGNSFCFMCHCTSLNLALHPCENLKFSLTFVYFQCMSHLQLLLLLLSNGLLLQRYYISFYLSVYSLLIVLGLRKSQLAWVFSVKKIGNLVTHSKLV